MKNQKHFTSFQFHTRIQLLIILCLSFTSIKPIFAQQIGGAVIGFKAGISIIDYKDGAADLTPLISYRTGF
ncbi:MAG: hypothetical protein ACPG49_00980 [Chitinophagales bacterium]